LEGCAFVSFFFAVPVFLINFLWSLYGLWKLGISFRRIFGVILAAAFWSRCSARLFALAVQDRVIRLEERLPYERVLPADLQPRCAELTIGQIVGCGSRAMRNCQGLARKCSTKTDGGKAIKPACARSLEAGVF